MRTPRHGRPWAAAAAVLSVLAVVLSATGWAVAERGGKKRTQARALVLGADGTIPVKYLPKKVPAARRADSLGGLSPEQLTTSCAPTTVDLGSYCMMTSPYPLANEELGKSNYFFASQKCAELGGWLPTAAELVGAAAQVKLSSTIDDAQLTATIDLDPSDGLKDRREMSATLVTTAAGSSAAGSQGVTEGSRGDPKQGEPDPTPFPANPQPETLQYVTVYDNRDQGGFAGARPVAQAESFRCAFGKVEGAAEEEAG